MKRRDFLRYGASKAAEAAVEVAGDVAGINLRDVDPSWIRPPFARPEADFLQACTRCDLCIEACPHDVIFKLRSHVGLLAAGTPALDLTRRGCHLCADWPCVTVCEPEALTLPAAAQAAVPPVPNKLAEVTINTETCLPYAGPECGACAGSCPAPGALNWDGVRPVIDAERCLGCARCLEACITDPKSVNIALIPIRQEVDIGD